MTHQNIMLLVLSLCSACQQANPPASPANSNSDQALPAQSQLTVDTATPSGPRWATTCVAISPDGARLAVGDAGGNIMLHDIAANIDLWSLDGNGQPVHDLTFLGDGRILATGEAVRVLAAGDGVVVDTIDAFPSGVSCLIVASGDQILAATGDGRVLVYSLMQKMSEELGQQDSPVVAIDASRDGLRAATAGQDKIVRLWNLDRRQVAQEFPSGDADLTCVAISPRQDQIAAGNAVGNVLIWNVAAAESALTLPQHPGKILRVRFTLDNDRVLTATDDGFVRLFSTSDGELLASCELGSAVRDLALSPEGTLLAAGAVSGETFLIQVAADLQVLRTAVRTPLE